MLDGVQDVLRSLNSKPQVALLDLWGVVHDGDQLYPGAVEALKTLHEAGVQVVFVSNSSFRASDTQAMLDRYHIPHEYYQGMVTAGEAAYVHFSEDTTPHRYYYMGREHGDIFKDLAHMTRVSDPAKADMVVAAAFSEQRPDIAAATAELEACARHHLPMVCTNPDTITITADGKVRNQGGQMGMAYLNMEGAGGVRFFGKPYKEVYDLALKRLGGSTPKNKVVVMGDSPSHDIVGGNAQGFKTVLITHTGILGASLHAGSTLEDIHGLCREHIKHLPAPPRIVPDPVPQMVIPGFAPGKITARARGGAELA